MPILRKIIHVDLDCFYAAVECRDRPELRGKAIAVGGSPEGRGVVATASYEARKFGVKSAMSSRTAIRLCPELIMVRPEFAKYKKESRKIRDVMLRFSEFIEPLSLDEAYLDVTASPKLSEFQGSASRLAAEIRRLIREETGLTASAGVAPNKFLAKIASDMNKPDGLTVVRPDQIDAFMKPLPIEKIWGVGKVTAAKMHRLGFSTCGELQKASLQDLKRHFGSWGSGLYDYCRGIDERPVRTDRERKSLSVEETYSKDLSTWREIALCLPELYADWNERAVRADINSSTGGSIRGLSAKVKFHDFEVTTADRVFSGYPSERDFLDLLEVAYLRRSEPVRLVGIGVKLETRSRTSNAESKTGQLAFDV